MPKLKNIEKVKLGDFIKDLECLLKYEENGNISLITNYGRIALCPLENGKFDVSLQQCEIPGCCHFEVGNKEVQMYKE